MGDGWEKNGAPAGSAGALTRNWVIWAETDREGRVYVSKWAATALCARAAVSAFQLGGASCCCCCCCCCPSADCASEDSSAMKAVADSGGLSPGPAAAAAATAAFGAARAEGSWGADRPAAARLSAAAACSSCVGWEGDGWAAAGANVCCGQGISGKRLCSALRLRRGGQSGQRGAA
jgi:hypothetical protein